MENAADRAPRHSVERLVKRHNHGPVGLIWHSKRLLLLHDSCLDAINAVSSKTHLADALWAVEHQARPPEEIRAFADAQGAAARRSRLPPFREVTYHVTPMSATVTTRWYLRRGHPFIPRSVVFPFHNAFQQTGPNAFKLMVGPRYFTGTNTIRRTWKWDI